MWSICTMTYGDYPDLIGKTLDSIYSQFNSRIKDIRIGLNAVSDVSFSRVMQWCGSFKLCPVYVYQEVNNKNVGKYPLMRRMLYEEPSPLAGSEGIMWFDDDSYLDAGVTDLWWDKVDNVSRMATVVGLQHVIGARGNQWQGIRAQPWYRDQHIQRRHRFTFITGGWWLAQSEFLQKWDYPFPEIYHNGGDSILGELCRQQSATLHDFKSDAQCHADCCYKQVDRAGVVHVNEGGRKGRRGLGKKTSEEVYPWQFYGVRPDNQDHHQFDIRMYKYDNVR